MTFIDEILLEAEKADEQRRLEMDKVRADYTLKAIQVLETQVDEVNKIADEEIRLIEEYRQAEAERLNKKVRWLAWNLEQFMRSTDLKTLKLPHGVLKVRLGRDKVEIMDLQKFIDDQSNQQFLKVIPESYQPNLTAILEYIKQSGHLPDGVNMIPAETKFHYSTINGGTTNGKDSQ